MDSRSLLFAPRFVGDSEIPLAAQKVPVPAEATARRAFRELIEELDRL
jgi:hypothetical protein